jgi:hypothetical protein
VLSGSGEPQSEVWGREVVSGSRLDGVRKSRRKLARVGLAEGQQEREDQRFRLGQLKLQS